MNITEKNNEYINNNNNINNNSDNNTLKKKNINNNNIKQKKNDEIVATKLSNKEASLNKLEHHHNYHFKPASLFYSLVSPVSSNYRVKFSRLMKNSLHKSQNVLIRIFYSFL